MPETKSRFEALGAMPGKMGPEEFRAHIHGELQRWAKVCATSGKTRLSSEGLAMPQKPLAVAIEPWESGSSSRATG
jgi:hypothetical protein